MTSERAAPEERNEHAPFGSRYAGYASFHPDWHEQDAPWKASHVVAMLRDHHLAPARVCDLGCGTGGVLDELRRLMPSVTSAVGYEQSPEATALAPAGRTDRVELVNGDIDDGRRFDLALVLDVIEHVPDPQHYLRRARDKADWFILHVPLDRSVAGSLRPGYYAKLRRTMGHLHAFTRRSALATIAAADFDIVDARPTHSALERPTTRLQRIIRGPRGLLTRVSPRLAARALGGTALLVLARPR